MLGEEDEEEGEEKRLDRVWVLGAKKGREEEDDARAKVPHQLFKKIFFSLNKLLCLLD